MAIQRKTVLLPTDAQAVAYRRRLAAAGSRAQMGIDVTTPAHWVEGLWELWGDGRRPVPVVLRQALLLRSLRAGRETLAPAAGAALQAARLVAALGGLPGFELAVLDPASRPGGLCPQEHELLDAVGRYYAALDRRGLVEPLRELPGILDRVPAGSVELAGLHMLDPNMEKALLLLGAEVERRAGGRPVACEGGAEVCLRKATGPTAIAPQVVAAALEARGCGGPILVVAPDPAGLFSLVRADLAQVGLSCAVHAGRAFRTTFVGRALASAHAVMAGDDPLASPRIQAVDFSTNPLSGANRFEALQMDATLRCDRLLGREQILELLGRTCPDLEVFLDALRAEKDPLVALDGIEALVRERLGTADARCALELRALAQVREACLEGVGVAEFLELAAGREVPAPACTCLLARGAAPDVLLTALRDVPDALAAYVPERSVPQAIFAGATSADYAASSPHGAAVELASKLGLPAPGPDLDRAVGALRCSFSHLLQVASSRLTLVLPDRDGAGDPVRPAFFVEELLAAGDVRQAGEVGDEGRLAGNFGATSVPSERWDRAPVTDFGVVDPHEVLSRMRFLRVDDGQGGMRDLPVLSPSQIEDYIKCPYLWYMRHCLRVAAPDDELSALSRGRFVHQVLERFLNAAMGQGEPRVTRSNVDGLHRLFAQVFDETARAQGGRQGLRYAVLGPTESYDLDLLKRTLLNNLRGVQSLFVPDHEVYRGPDGRPGLEVSIRPEERIVFAGAVIRGTVDRVDVDRQAGTFLVVDYKGSLGTEYDTLYPGDPEYNATGIQKVQADIYAAVLARSGAVMGDDMCPLRPAGALYLDYTCAQPPESVRGSCSRPVEAQLRAMGFRSPSEKKRCGYDDYDDHLRNAEDYIAGLVRLMMSGNVMPQPFDDSSCKFCPARTVCPDAKGENDG